MSKVKWVIDQSHSEIGFKVKHMMFTNVSGKLRKFNSLITTSVDVFENAKIEFDGDIDSITTNNEERDMHLLSADFFDAQRFPKVNFDAVAFDKIDEVNYKLTGSLSMHGVTKLITLDTEFSGLLRDPWGVIKAGFNIRGTINRKDWNLNWNTPLDSGGILIGEEVRLNIDLQFIRK